MVVIPPGMLSGAVKLYSVAWTVNRLPMTGPAEADAAGFAEAAAEDAAEAAGLADAAVEADATGLADVVLTLAEAVTGAPDEDETEADPPQAANASARLTGRTTTYPFTI
jgi:hypothetical protein